MRGPYAVEFRISDMLWQTTVGGESIEDRARTRARLRAQARGVWGEAKRHGAYRVERYMMIVHVGGRTESPVLAAETLKPVIDAGTDMGLWPDDDPAHRLMTLYARDPRRMQGRGALIHVTVVECAVDWSGWDCLHWLLASTGAEARGVMPVLSIPDALWLTSNMRLPAGQRQDRQSAVMRLAEPVWREQGGLGAHVLAVAAVSYPDARYYGDPDNTAETVTAMYGTGVALGKVPAVPEVFAFMLNPVQCDPHSHLVQLACVTVPIGWSVLSTLLAGGTG